MNFSSKDIKLLQEATFVASKYGLIKNEYVLQKLTEFNTSLIMKENHTSYHGAQSAYSCLLVVADLIDGTAPNIKLKYKDKRNISPLKNSILDLARRMDENFNFEN